MRLIPSTDPPTHRPTETPKHRNTETPKHRNTDTMGHDISGFTKDGHRIGGPGFPRYWFPHYEIFEAEHRNAGCSGDGESETMTPERLQRARQACLKRLESSKKALCEIQQEIRNAPPQAGLQSPKPGPASDRTRFVMVLPGEREGDEPQVLRLRDLRDPLDSDDTEEESLERRFQFARYEVEAFLETIEFIDRCLAEDVVRIMFW